MGSKRAKLAAQKLYEIIRKGMNFEGLTMGKILREVGYSRKTSLIPKLVTSTKTYNNELGIIIADPSISDFCKDVLKMSKTK